MDLSLYVITDRKLAKRLYAKMVEEAIKGGATAIQLRDKLASDSELIKIGKNLKEICKQNNVTFIVNDRVNVAKKINANGVHLGPDDMSIELARKILPDKIIGYTVKNVEEARKVEKYADYLSVGAVFKTKTKITSVIGLGKLKEIKESVSLPVIAIGGINSDNVMEVLKTGVDGIAVISAVMGKKNIEKATRELRNKIDYFKLKRIKLYNKRR